MSSIKSGAIDCGVFHEAADRNRLP